MRFFIALFVVAIAPGVAAAQVSGGSQSYGSFGNRTIGGGINGISSGGVNTSATGSASANTSLGQLGSSSTSATGGSQLTGNERFLRENRQGAFVGADSGDAVNLMSQQQGTQQGANNAQGLQSFFSQLNRMNQQNQTRNTQGRNSKQTLRIPMRAEIEMPLSYTSTNVNSQLQTRLTKLPALKASGIQVTMQGRTAVLSGRVATEREKRLAAGVAQLEPGVGDVQNDLIVDPASANAAAR
jgi:osmotically-inducible protein OsmY